MRIPIEDKVSIEINFSTSLEIDCEEYFDDYNDNYFKPFYGKILLKIHSGTFEEKIENLGYVEVWHIDGSRAIDNRLDIVDICDSIEQELYEYASAIYTDGYIEESLVPTPRTNDVLVLHRIEIDKKYRGKKYGLIIANRILISLGYNCGAILIKPSPIQFSEISEDDIWQEKYDTTMFTQDRKEAHENLFRYWEKLGMQKSKKLVFYIFLRIS